MLEEKYRPPYEASHRNALPARPSNIHSRNDGPCRRSCSPPQSCQETLHTSFSPHSQFPPHPSCNSSRQRPRSSRRGSSTPSHSRTSSRPRSPAGSTNRSPSPLRRSRRESSGDTRRRRSSSHNSLRRRNHGDSRRADSARPSSYAPRTRPQYETLLRERSRSRSPSPPRKRHRWAQTRSPSPPSPRAPPLPSNATDSVGPLPRTPAIPHGTALSMARAPPSALELHHNSPLIFAPSSTAVSCGYCYSGERLDPRFYGHHAVTCRFYQEGNQLTSTDHAGGVRLSDSPDSWIKYNARLNSEITELSMDVPNASKLQESKILREIEQVARNAVLTSTNALFGIIHGSVANKRKRGQHWGGDGGRNRRDAWKGEDRRVRTDGQGSDRGDIGRRGDSGRDSKDIGGSARRDGWGDRPDVTSNDNDNLDHHPAKRERGRDRDGEDDSDKRPEDHKRADHSKGGNRDISQGNVRGSGGARREYDRRDNRRSTSGREGRNDGSRNKTDEGSRGNAGGEKGDDGRDEQQNRMSYPRDKMGGLHCVKGTKEQVPWERDRDDLANARNRQGGGQADRLAHSNGPRRQYPTDAGATQPASGPSAPSHPRTRKQQLRAQKAVSDMLLAEKDDDFSNSPEVFNPGVDVVLNPLKADEGFASNVYGHGAERAIAAVAPIIPGLEPPGSTYIVPAFYCSNNDPFDGIAVDNESGQVRMIYEVKQIIRSKKRHVTLSRREYHAARRMGNMYTLAIVRMHAKSRGRNLDNIRPEIVVLRDPHGRAKGLYGSEYRLSIAKQQGGSRKVRF
ncbi:hypothetical protein M427DRAFT_76035 [Gonapodya prolifera JEL478]|uniref:Protein NO VEIN C-terminal domain-containing protein n=1 Tax=Gonapodya prolifera (strain JEL478) TaxID=1344416 RepID=A0A138ZY33_GONPJ|nr:hypothetical protein M427DRAFT_76035 [Gonapodya prolifera JEL478]|eukprot:KXS09043.1 hypothetical protein M427DRAFT_76035 [Gonapodya prolifera JEL478]